MKTLNQEVYRCSHCKKWYLKSYACLKHETFCKKNPNNKHACFAFCRYLERNKKLVENSDTQYKYDNQSNDFFRIERHAEITFKCTLKNIDLYSFKAEYVNMIKEKRLNEEGVDLTGLTRMPLHCKDHKYEQKIIDQY